MAAKFDEIRLAAIRVAASHGLDVVDVELSGPAKERVLRVFLEKDTAGRERLKAEIEAGSDGLPERLAAVLGVCPADLLHGRILRKALDARDKDALQFVYTAEVAVSEMSPRF